MSTDRLITNPDISFASSSYNVPEPSTSPQDFSEKNISIDAAKDENLSGPLMSEAILPDDIIDPKLQVRALKRMQGILKGNGIKAEDIKVETSEAKVFTFGARSFIKLSPSYGIRLEPGQNRQGELVTKLDDFNKAIQTVMRQCRLEIGKRGIIADYLITKPNKGFGEKDRITKFHSLKRDFVMHEGCSTCNRKGRIQCSKCSGQTIVTCPSCKGGKSSVCPACKGSGRGAQGTKCNRCRGEGSVRCSQCGSQGHVKCPQCSASGLVQCQKCSATGWVSHLAHIEVEAHIHFDFDRRGMPHDLVRLIETRALLLIEKGDLEADLCAQPKNLDDITRLNEPDDMIFIDYTARIPYGNIHFRIKNRIIPAVLMGYQSRLIEAPVFLNDFTRKGQHALKEASLGHGDVGENIRKAARYRLIHDIILMAAGKTSHKKALAKLSLHYPIGIGANHLSALLRQSDKSLRLITRKPRAYGLFLGSCVAASLMALYFLIIRAPLSLSISPHILLIGDLSLILLGGILAIIGAQIFSYSAQTKALKDILSTGQTRRLLPRLGYVTWIAFAVNLGLWLIIVGAMVIYDFTNRPDWTHNLFSNFL